MQAAVSAVAAGCDQPDELPNPHRVTNINQGAYWLVG